jgi:hypothetical protein
MANVLKLFKKIVIEKLDLRYPPENAVVLLFYINSFLLYLTY